MFDDINQGINKQDIGTEKVWSFFLAFSDKSKVSFAKYFRVLYLWT